MLEDKKKKPKAKTSSKKSKGKQKEGESSSFVQTEDEGHSNFKHPSEEEVISDNGSTQSKRMSKIEQRLEALANQNVLQEAGVVQSYPTELDLFPIPS